MLNITLRYVRAPFKGFLSGSYGTSDWACAPDGVFLLGCGLWGLLG